MILLLSVGLTIVNEFIGVSFWLVASANCSGRAIQFAYQLMIGFCLDSSYFAYASEKRSHTKNQAALLLTNLLGLVVDW